MTGAELKELRKNLGLTQKQMGELVGVKLGQIAKLEAGDNRIAGAMLKLLEKIKAEG